MSQVKIRGMVGVKDCCMHGASQNVGSESKPLYFLIRVERVVHRHLRLSLKKLRDHIEDATKRGLFDSGAVGCSKYDHAPASEAARGTLEQRYRVRGHSGVRVTCGSHHRRRRIV